MAVASQSWKEIIILYTYSLYLYQKYSMKFHILVFGCQMNYSDSARIKAILINGGRSRSDSIEDADIVVFDTCSVRQKSEDKVFGTLKEIPKNKKIRLTGCMVQHYLKTGKITKQRDKKQTASLKLGNFVWGVKTANPTIIGWQEEDLEWYARFDSPTGDYLFVNHAFNPLYKKMYNSFHNIELLFRIDDVGMLPRMIQALGYTIAPDIDVFNEYTGILPQWTNQLLLEQSKTAYVPISTWCSQFCAYCIVPYSRGLEKNRAVDEILAEVRHHLDQGIEEIVLLGQIVNKHPDFVSILQEVLRMPWLRWLRYTSPYPTYYTPELLHLHETEEKLCPHIHMPLQSGSDVILKKMFRGYTVAEYRWFVDAIRALKRPISITTDIIIGFCDETEDDFQGSLDMMEYAKFDMVYMGIYSPRPWTIWAKKYTDNVSRDIKKARWQRMNDTLLRTSLDNNHSEIGTQRLMMVNKIEDDFFSGYTDNMKTVIVKWEDRFTVASEVPKLSDFVSVEITEVAGLKLFAKRI
jgi:tRNA-2-methylthio-N6-dimethylallyladenosine synthase